MNDPARPRVVLATAIYPPDGRVGALRPAKLVQHLIKRGCEVDVVTSNLTGAVSGRGAHGEQVHVVVSRTTLRDVYLRLRGDDSASSDGDERASTGEKPRASTLTDNFRSLLVVPDLERGIIRPMARRVRQLLRERPAILYSTSPPHSTQVAARLAVAGSRTPWIAEFRDPWTDAGQRLTAQHDATRRTLNRILERAVLRRVDGLVAVSDGIADWLRVRAPTTPIVTSRNGIDHVAHGARRPVHQDQSVNALYVGELYLGRDPTPLFAALQALLAAGRVRSSEIRCAFVGDVMTYRDTPTAQLVAFHGLNDVVTLSDRVPRADALARQDQSDLLILFAQDQPRQVPNKLYDYLGTRRPILAFADEGGETARLLRDVGGHFIVTGDLSPGEVATKVEAAMRSAATGASVGAPERLHLLMTGPQLDRAADLVEEIWRSAVNRGHGTPATASGAAMRRPGEARRPDPK